MNLNFKNKTVIITGGTRGIGKSLVHIFNDVGANIIITGTKKYNNGNEILENNSRIQYKQLDYLSDKSLEQYQTEPQHQLL